MRFDRGAKTGSVIQISLSIAVLEACLLLILFLWALGSVCYAFRVPGIHWLLNRHNRFEIFTSWAVATTRGGGDRPGAYAVDFQDVPTSSPTAEWVRAAATDDWVWHAFLWFPGKVAAYRLQAIGREIVFYSKVHAAPQRLEHLGRTLERFLDTIHPRPAGLVRHVRMVRRIVEREGEIENVIWQSNVRRDASPDRCR